MSSSRKKTPAQAPQKTTKGETLRMRVSSEQKAAIEAAAENDGMTVSVWLRRLALKEAGLLPEPKKR